MECYKLCFLRSTQITLPFFVISVKMDDDMSINSTDQSSSSSDDSLLSIKMEKCLLENAVVNIPDELCERVRLYFNFVNYSICDDVAAKTMLTAGQKT